MQNLTAEAELPGTAQLDEYATIENELAEVATSASSQRKIGRTQRQGKNSEARTPFGKGGMRTLNEVNQQGAAEGDTCV